MPRYEVEGGDVFASCVKAHLEFLDFGAPPERLAEIREQILAESPDLKP